MKGLRPADCCDPLQHRPCSTHLKRINDGYPDPSPSVGLVRPGPHLLPLDSDYEWGEFTIRLGWNDPVEFARRNDEFYAHYQAGTLDVHDYVRFATEAVRLRGLRPPRQPMRSSCAR